MIDAGTIDVRRAERADWPALADFIGATYGTTAPYKDFARYRWQFIDNPHGDGDARALPIWLAFDGRMVVGAMAAQLGTLQLGRRRLRAGWVVDVMNHPAYRGQGLGHRIHRAMMAEMPVLVTLTMAAATRRIAEMAGCVTLGEARQWSRIAAPSAGDVSRYLLDRTKYHSGPHRVAKLGVRLGLGYCLVPLTRLAGRRARSAYPQLRIQEVRTFGEAADRLWQRVGEDYPAIFVRDARHLDWRFGQVPHLAYRRFIAWRGSEPAGIMVLRRTLPDELRSGIISELLCGRDDEDAMRALVDFAVRHFGDDVASIEAASSLPLLDGVLQQAGFRVTRRVHATFIARDPQVRALAEQYKDQWYFTKGDHDWDQVHPL